MSEESKETKEPTPEVKEIHHYHHNRGFSLGSLFIGLILIAIGLLYFARNLGIIDDFNLNISQLWPLILIFFGLSFLSKRSWLSILAGVVLIIVILSLVVANGFKDGTQETFSQETIQIGRQESIDSYEINLKTGAGKLNIEGDAKDLVDGVLKSNFITLSTDSRVRNNTQVIDIIGRGNWNNWGRGARNSLDLQLNSELPVALNIDSGTSDIDADLSRVQAREVNFDTGASSVNLVMGDKVSSKVNMKSGASSIDITLPQAVGARVKIDSGISSKDLSGFEKKNEKEYETSNYSTAEKKIDFDFDLGASSLKIDRE